tara:strand:- start:197 stop:451 length:255 start_codon:yes stop_codon:yes gene_type:complete
MRQKFDIGDLIEVSFPSDAPQRGIVLETKIINNHLLDERCYWHVDEYKCKVKFMDDKQSPPRWVRAKWLRHISKITKLITKEKV